jgi:hypothetical protein
MEQARPVHLPEKMRVRVPRGLPALVQAAASRECTTPSDFIRRAIVQAVRTAGIELCADGCVEGRASGGGSA